MKEMIDTMNIIFATVGGFIGGLLGGFDGFLYALVVFVVIDYCTGIIAACMQKRLSSQIGFVGIVKKVIIFLLVAVANTVDAHVIGAGNVARTAVVFFYISNEGISILENASVIGLPIPKKLKEILLQLKDKGGNKNE